MTDLTPRSTVRFNPWYAWALIGVLASAVVSLFLSFQAGVWLLFFLIVAWWVWEHPEGGFLLFIVLAPILPMLKITQTIATFTLVKDVIIFTLLLRLVVVPLVTKQLPYRRNTFLAPLVALGVWTTFAMLRADSLILGVLRARDIGLYALLFLAVLYLPHSAKRLTARVRWFVLTILAVLLLGVYQWFWAVDSAVLRFDPVREVWIPRLSSILAHPSIFGEYLLLAGTLFAGVVLVAAKARRQVLFGGLLTLLVPFIFLTYSRAVWIGFAAALAAVAVAWLARMFFLKTERRNVWRYVTVGGVTTLLVLVILLRLTPVGVFVRSAFDPTYGSNEERLEFLARLIGPLSNTEALIGKGLGDVLEQNFREVDLSAYDIATGSSRTVQLTKNRTLVDNQYLKTFVEMGLAGLLIYAWLFWRFLTTAWQAIVQRSRPLTQTLGWWGIGFLAAFVVQAMFIDIWDIFPTNAAWWIVAALLSATSKA